MEGFPNPVWNRRASLVEAAKIGKRVNPQYENTFWLLQFCAPAASVAVLAAATSRAARTSRPARGGEAGLGRSMKGRVRSSTAGACVLFLGSLRASLANALFSVESWVRTEGNTFGKSRTGPDSARQAEHRMLLLYK